MDKKNHLRMCRWLDEIEADVNSHVTFFVPIASTFALHKGGMLLIKKLDNRDPAILVIHVISKPRRINHSQTNIKSLFFNIYYEKDSKQIRENIIVKMKISNQLALRQSTLFARYLCPFSKAASCSL